MIELPLATNGRYTTFIDECDLDYVSRWRWSYKLSARRYRQRVYAKRTTRIKGACVTILLSHFILELAGQLRPSDLHDADHLDGNSLNNTRNNLRWRHQKKNRASNNDKR